MHIRRLGLVGLIMPNGLKALQHLNYHYLGLISSNIFTRIPAPSPLALQAQGTTFDTHIFVISI